MKQKVVLLLCPLVVLTLGSTVLSQEQAPDEVVLDSLAELYQPVVFDHAMHNELMEQNCAICHHHTTGLAPVDERCRRCHAAGQEAAEVGCRDCHPANRYDAAYLAALAADPLRYHVDKPGVKGAYHRLCLGCHREMDGPTGCQECHSRTDAGERLFRTGAYSPASPAGESHY